MKIFTYRESSLNVLNGVKSLSMAWVILGHTYAFVLFFLVNILNM